MLTLIIAVVMIFSGVFLGVLFGAQPSTGGEDQPFGKIAAGLIIVGCIVAIAGIVEFLVGFA